MGYTPRSTRSSTVINPQYPIQISPLHLLWHETRFSIVLSKVVDLRLSQIRLHCKQNCSWWSAHLDSPMWTWSKVSEVLPEVISSTNIGRGSLDCWCWYYYLRVRIQAGLSTHTKHFYSVRKHPHPKADSKVYFLEERTDGFYQVTFGDGVLGKNLDTDNVVLVDYIVSNGVAEIWIRGFRSPTNFTGNAETVTGTTVLLDKTETIDSIRFNAPRFNSAKVGLLQGDYESCKDSNPNIKSVTIGVVKTMFHLRKDFSISSSHTGFVITQETDT